MKAKRVSGLDRCGCTQTSGAPHYYDTCPVHAEPLLDRGVRGGKLEVYGVIIPTAIVAGLVGLTSLRGGFPGSLIGWTIIVVAAIVLVVTLIAQAIESRPRYRP